MGLQNEFLFGAAYYDEYAPCERLEEDMRLMRAAGFNVIRIAESTWSVEEPRPGEYDFSHVDRVIDAAARHGLRVIVGTPTYAVPPWLAALDPGVLAITKNGQNRFGPRQNMDITNPTYRQYAERIIRALVSRTAGRENVIGFQIDNETKHYGTAGPAVLARFRQWMQARFGDVDTMNQALGLAHWSATVSRFEDLPDPTGAVNGSYACEFARFQRELAAEFLCWQAQIVREYLRPGQFITNNFDFDWCSFGAPGQQDGFSHGVQPDIDHYDAARAVTLVGTDIYFFPQDQLTGWEIAFGGDEMRALQKGRYLVLESQSQAFRDWLPYPGQLRQMAWSHIASGARGVMYWPWASLHNGIESYWKGILSHDLCPGATYEEVAATGRELHALEEKLPGIAKKNRIAVVISAEALHALRWAPTDKDFSYNDMIRRVHGALYGLNLECDVLYEQEEDWSGYDLLVFPQLYTVRPGTTARIRAFVEAGGTVFATFRSFVADEHLKIFHDPLPHDLTDVFGLTYDQWTKPVDVTVDGQPADYWMELLRPAAAETVAPYAHKYWGRYAAVTRNRYGQGTAWYLGALPAQAVLQRFLLAAARDAGIEAPPERWPVVLKNAVREDGTPVHFLFHYASRETQVESRWNAVDLLTGNAYRPGEAIPLSDWGVAVLLEV